MGWITRTWTKVWNSVLSPHLRSFLFLLFLQCLVTKVSKIIQIAPVFSISNSPSPFTGGFLTLYILFQSILALHLLIMQVTTRVSVPSATFPNLQWVAATKTALFRGHFLINAARTLVVGIQCRGDNFSLNCSYTMLPWLSCGTCPFSWDALGGCRWWRAILPY